MTTHLLCDPGPGVTAAILANADKSVVPGNWGC